MTPDEESIRAVLALHPESELAILFGSLAAGEARADRDVDLAIDTGQPLTAEAIMDWIGEIAQCTGRPVDLIDLQTVGEPLLGQILEHGKRLAGADTAYAELIKRHLFAEADFMPYQRRILAERRKSWFSK
ncbi:MAG: nucleotidyltransferase domain-containing protein [Propionivibrio sp.]